MNSVEPSGTIGRLAAPEQPERVVVGLDLGQVARRGARSSSGRMLTSLACARQDGVPAMGSTVRNNDLLDT
jgi:hypothetical protein